MLKTAASLLFVLCLATACSTPRTARFSEEDQADLIVRYYSEDTSYVLKPTKTDGPFLSIFNRDAVLDVAKQQPRRRLAVVILIHYRVESEAEMVKHTWTTKLTQVGYHRVVFLRSLNGKQVNGLPILASSD
jgi:hypothetical protein